MLKLLNNKVNTPKHVKNLVEINQLHCENNYSAKKLFIGQGEIVQMFDNSTLFPKENFLPVSHDSFRYAYSKYAEDILSYLKKSIKKEEAINGLRKNSLEYSELNNIATYFIQIECDKDFSSIDNIHNTPKKDLSSIIDKIGRAHV